MPTRQNKHENPVPFARTKMRLLTRMFCRSTPVASETPAMYFDSALKNSDRLRHHHRQQLASQRESVRRWQGCYLNWIATVNWMRPLVEQFAMSGPGMTEHKRRIAGLTLGRMAHWNHHTLCQDRVSHGTRRKTWGSPDLVTLTTDGAGAVVVFCESDASEGGGVPSADVIPSALLVAWL